MYYLINIYTHTWYKSSILVSLSGDPKFDTHVRGPHGESIGYAIYMYVQNRATF